MSAAAVERARLAFLGTALGDAFGERFFGDPVEVQERLRSRSLPPSPWRYTDDTVLASAVLSVLAERGEVDCERLAAVCGARYLADPARGFGRGAHEVLAALGRGEPWEPTAQAVFGGLGSFGNGAAMRAAPVGAYFAEAALEVVIAQAERSARVTHAHPDGIAGAVAVAVATALAWRRRGAWPADPLELVAEVAAATGPGATREGLLQAAKLSLRTDTQSAAMLLGNGSRIAAEDTVPLCVWLAAKWGDEPLELALWETVSALGDRDTTCAIVGGILAGVAGEAGLPAAWRAALEPWPREWGGVRA